MISPGGSTTATLTIFFSLGQIVGPVVAGLPSELSGKLNISVLIAAISIICGRFFVLVVRVLSEKNSGEDSPATVDDYNGKPIYVF